MVKEISGDYCVIIVLVDHLKVTHGRVDSTNDDGHIGRDARTVAVKGEVAGYPKVGIII